MRKITGNTLLVLRTFLDAPTKEVSGPDICKQTGLLSGTLYQILMRLERSGWLASEWEQINSYGNQSRWRLYKLTGVGYEKTREAIQEKQNE